MYKVKYKIKLLFAIALLAAINVNANTYTVTSTNNSGAGSLRQAILDANTNPGTDNIVFNIPGGGVQTITLTQLLPLITDPVHIQGYTQPEAAAGPIGSRTINIQVNGGNTTTTPSGRTAGDGLFRFTSGAGGSSISGLSIYNTGSSTEAIQLQQGLSNVHIWGNYIGVLANGSSPSSSAEFNKDDGILLGNYDADSGSFTNITIGTNGDGANDANEGNVISNAADAVGGGDGIQLGTANGTYTWSNIRISGNYIGLAADGITAAPNGINEGDAPYGGSGINNVGGSNLLIGSNGNGTSDAQERNIISGNTGNGIELYKAASNVSIAGNYIGTDKTGMVAVPNGTASTSSLPYIGILVLGTSGDISNVVIGFDDTRHTAANAAAVRNVISGNYGLGVQVYNNMGTGNRISGNYIGVNATGNTALGNGQANIAHPAAVLFAVGVDITVAGNVLVGTNSNGTNDVYERNIISGNIDARGVYIRNGSTANVVAGNYIGVGADGTTAVGNDFPGVHIDASGSNRIGSNDDGTNDAAEANIIANNGKSVNIANPSGDGLRITGNATRNRISRNIFFNNKQNAIDLSNDGVTANDGVTTASSPNILLDYPVFTAYGISGSTMTVSGYAGACGGVEGMAGTTIDGTLTVQVYRQADDGDQDGAISAGSCSRSVAHGEGIQYLGSITITGGTFTNATFTLVPGASFSPGDKITGITIDANGNTSEFGAIAQTLPFPCENTLYLQNGNTLYEYSVSGSQTPLFYTGNINALAFSTTGLLWAFDQTAQSVVIIGADGSKTPITIPGLPVGGADYNVGAIDVNGYYYLYNGQQAARFYIIDTDPARPATYGQLVDPAATGGVVPYDPDTRSPNGTQIYPLPPNHANRRLFSDWCINPADGQLYTVTNSTSYRPYRLVSYNPVSGQLTEHTGQIGGDGFQGNVSFGAIFIDLFGNFFVFGNTHGHLYSIDTTTATATRLSTNSISSSNIDGANCILADEPLPIHLLSFDANKKGNTAELVWATASEQNNKGFDIEHSTDGRTWTAIGFVNSKGQNGNSSVRLDYDLTDNTPAGGPNYYRLKQIDLNGKYEYSAVRMVSFGKGDNVISIYPNPARDNISIRGLSGGEAISIYDMTGRKLKELKNAGSATTVSLDELNQGVYHISIIAADGYNVSSHKVIVSK